MDKFKRLAKFYFTFLSEAKPDCINLFEFTLAQWALESGWGKSGLAQEFNNFGGMKFRPCIEKRFPEGRLYKDWEGEERLYFYLDDLSYYPMLYFAFIGRSPYKGWTVHRANGRDFIKFIAKCGYCGSMPGVEKQDVPEAYAKKIESIVESGTFKEVLDYAYGVQS